MRVCSVGTGKYEADIGQLLNRRLGQEGGLTARSLGRGGAEAGISGPEGFRAWCRALSDVLTMDLSQFELAYMVNELPVSLEEKKAILPEAIRLSRRRCAREKVQEMLEEYFGSHDHLVLEGFMAFRMKECKQEWERCVIRAADELLLNVEYMELMQALAAFVRLRAPRMREVYVILNPDGSCTLTDEEELRIDYERCTTDGIMSILVGLAPERITVYDLSGGRSAGLGESLTRIFEGRVRFFR